MTTATKTKTEFQKELAARFFRAIVLSLANELCRINGQPGLDEVPLGAAGHGDHSHWPRQDAVTVAVDVKADRVAYDEALFPLAVEILRLGLHDNAQRPGYDIALRPNEQLVQLAGGVDDALETAIGLAPLHGATAALSG